MPAPASPSSAKPTRPLVLCGWWLGLFLCGTLGHPARLAAADPPVSLPPRPLNVVFILADDLGWGELGCFGQKKISTPHLDRLASEGMRLTQHYSGAPVCAPSRCVLLTGRHLGHAEIRGNQQASVTNPQFSEGQHPLSGQAVTFPKVLQQAGHVTGAMGKWGLGPVGSTGEPARQGIDHFFGYNCQAVAHSYYPPHLWRNSEKIPLNQPAIPGHLPRQPNAGAPRVEGEIVAADFIGRHHAPDEILAEAEGFLRNEHQHPFLLYLPFIEPHVAMHPPQADVDRFPPEWDSEPYRGGGGYLPHPRPRAAYAAMISRLDSYVGRILNLLDELHLADRTLVIFSSDNGTTHAVGNQPFHVGGVDPGFFQSTADLRGYKGSLYEGGIRVPTIVRLPGEIPAGTQSDFPSYFADWFPTICEALRLPLPQNLDGISLWPLLTGGPPPTRERPMVWVFPEYGGQVAVRWGDFKVIRQRLKTKQPGPWEVYNLKTDRGEQHDLAQDHPELIARALDVLRTEMDPNSVFPVPVPELQPVERPNVVFIAVDDLNDWIGPLGGHPLVQTPHLDRLAARGTVFLNAHCQAPLCNPSRTSLLLGLRPSTTGIHGLAPWFRSLPPLEQRVALPQAFQQAGYQTATAGKIFHERPRTPETQRHEFGLWGPAGGIGSSPRQKLIPPTPMGNHPAMDWGVFPHRDEDKGDFQVATWGCEQIRAAQPNEPFFLALGFFLPHVPCYATQPWFDLYPDDDTLLPETWEDDRADVPRFAWNLHWQLPEPRLAWLRQTGQWRNLVRSYLACTSFVDAQIGRVLDALEQTGQAHNTIVVVWGDHGWHLGEKGITGKNTLWERSTRVPLIWAGPGITPGQRSVQPAELLDIYPTLVELCRLAPRDDLEGHSLVPQLRAAETPRRHPAITTHNQGNHSVRSLRWRYIRYADGTEELYDHDTDRAERFNLALDPRHAGTLAEHRRWLPRVDAPPAPGSAHRVLTYDPATDLAEWEGQPVRRDDAIPE